MFHRDLKSRPLSDSDATCIGKTRVLTSRVAHLVEHHGLRPESICAVTFTNKAANEMRERLQKIIGRGPTLSLVMGLCFPVHILLSSNTNLMYHRHISCHLCQVRALAAGSTRSLTSVSDTCESTVRRYLCRATSRYAIRVIGMRVEIVWSYVDLILVKAMGSSTNF